jgi:hypothetical protein
MTQLELAEKWLVSSGKVCKGVVGKAPDGSEIAGLEIQHGAFGVLAFQLPEMPGALVLRAMVTLPAPLRTSIARLSDDAARDLFVGLRQALQSGDRTGYAILPPTMAGVRDVTGYYAEQVLRLDESDPGSFNRLLDAIQELVVVITRANGMFQTVVGIPTQGTQKQPVSFPDPMYR